MKVLVVEDDPDIRELLTLYFVAKGHEVETAPDGQEALAQLQRVQPDLMLLDVVLPKLDGWSVLTAVRAQSGIPVILLTSLDDTDDVIKGLSLGADDYLRKPFEIRELEARIQSIIRRIEPLTEPQNITLGPLAIDERAKFVTIHGEPISLSPKEFHLLALLASDLGRAGRGPLRPDSCYPDRIHGRRPDPGRVVLDSHTRACVVGLARSAPSRQRASKRPGSPLPALPAQTAAG